MRQIPQHVTDPKHDVVHEVVTGYEDWTNRQVLVALVRARKSQVLIAYSRISTALVVRTSISFQSDGFIFLGEMLTNGSKLSARSSTYAEALEWHLAKAAPAIDILDMRAVIDPGSLFPEDAAEPPS